MLRPLLKMLGLTLMLLAASAGVVYYQNAYSTTRQIDKLKDEKQALEQIVTRLSSDTRVADILVNRQERNDKGELETTLLLVEYDKNGSALPARSFTVRGDYVHIDAMVIKFEQGYIQANDAFRGHSIALFTKIYGHNETPANAQMIDTPGKIPDIYRTADPRITEFEMSLWNDFWKLYDDESYRQSKGVRTSSGQGVWGIFKPDRLYTITIQPDGGPVLVSSPLKGIYREALKQRFDATTLPIAG